MFSIFIWNGKRTTNEILNIIKWCDKEYRAKWKDIEITVTDIPTQSLIGSSEPINLLQESIVLTTFHSVNIWSEFIKNFKSEKRCKAVKLKKKGTLQQLLSWFAYADRFKKGLSDRDFRNWGYKGITAMCTFINNGNMSFQQLK